MSAVATDKPVSQFVGKAERVDGVSHADTSNFEQRTRDFLETQNFGAVLTKLSAGQHAEFLQKVGIVFADLDGTLLPSGSKEIPALVVDAVVALNDLGVSTVFLTGKPYSEIRQIVEKLPDGFRAKFMYEKGAFYGEIGEGGVFQKRNLLTSQELADAIGVVKEVWRNNWKPEIDARFGVRMELAGDGTHESLFAVDVLRHDAPDDFMGAHHGDRRDIKVSDKAVLSSIFAEIDQKIRALNIPALANLNARDLGQANFEFTGGLVEKDLALLSMADMNAGYNVLTLGDSGNDAAMFRLGAAHPNLKSALVFHAHTPASLFALVDYSVAGEARGVSMLELLCQAKVQALATA